MCLDVQYKGHSSIDTCAIRMNCSSNKDSHVLQKWFIPQTAQSNLIREELMMPKWIKRSKCLARVSAYTDYKCIVFKNVNSIESYVIKWIPGVLIGKNRAFTETGEKRDINVSLSWLKWLYCVSRSSLSLSVRIKEESESKKGRCRWRTGRQWCIRLSGGLPGTTSLRHR